MKRSICFVLVMLVLMNCLTACGFVEKMFNKLEDKAEAPVKVEEMIAAIEEERIDDAKALMHPDVSEVADTTITQMIKYIDGRKAESVEGMGININISKGTLGKIRKEELSYKVTLSDGEVVNYDVVYISNSGGKGFTSFQLVLGIK